MDDPAPVVATEPTGTKKPRPPPTEEQRARKREREKERVRQRNAEKAAAAAAAMGSDDDEKGAADDADEKGAADAKDDAPDAPKNPASDAPKKSAPRVRKNKTPPAPADDSVKPSPPKRVRKMQATPVVVSPLGRDSATWANDTLLKWPGVDDVSIVVNDVFRTLASVPVAKEDGNAFIGQYRELFRLESDDAVLLRWAVNHQTLFMPLVYLLQAITPAALSKNKAVAPAGGGGASSLLNALLKKAAAVGIAPEVRLDPYVTRPEQDYRALSGLVKLANELGKDAPDEPRGGKAMHGFTAEVGADTTKNVARFSAAFIEAYPTNGQEQTTLVIAAFKALFC
jgi:hypothetical protein